MAPTMTEWDANSHFLAMFAATALLKDEQPQSLLLVGKPGQGKSALVQRFAQWPGVMQVSDLTADGLRDILRADDRTRILVMDELQRLFSHTYDAVQNVAGLLLSLMSGNAARELVGPTGRGSRVDLTGRRIGVMAAIPDDVLQQRMRDMEATGLLSRFCFLAIARSDEEAKRVRSNIYRRNFADLAPYPMPPKMPREMIEVASSAEVDAELEAWGSDVFEKQDDRKHKMLTVLVRSVALLHGRSKTTKQDVRMLRRFEPHLRSLEFNAVLTRKRVSPLRSTVTWAR